MEIKISKKDLDKGQLVVYNKMKGHFRVIKGELFSHTDYGTKLIEGWRQENDNRKDA